ncbi:uncharacterized protein ddias isoform X1 [Cottoperca gobio]|uniref:Uncharacterized protein ddias isoform X1 n=1 Tax=Cottoperca gobio TaxID=56716 RepID=A0A6J2PYR7_COTGO|nr:DNA damage-induced apoptosis suppressor protein isoform X1 [Cottoperca gobio]
MSWDPLILEQPPRPPAPTLLLIPHHSPASSIFNASGFLSLSQQSSQYQDGILNPTPPWQQSPGLVTSSAEQERSCSTQDGGDEHSRRTDNNKTPHRAQRGCLEYCEVTEERALSPFPSSRSPSFAKHPCSSIGGAVGNTPTLNISFSPSAPGHNSSKAEELSTKQLTETDLLSSLAWEDLPFSESLTEFLCEENNNFDIVSETEPRLNVQNQKETARNNLDPDKKVSHESASACQRNMQITDTRLLDTIGTPAPHERGRHDLSDRVYKNPAGCANKSQDICSRECFQDDDKVSFLSLQNEEEEQLEDDTYNCSADLFGSSLIMDMNTNELNTRAETVRTATGPRPLLSKPIKRPPRSGREAHSTPHRKKLKRKKCLNRESLIPTGTQDLDFIPPCQSTPIVKVAGVTRSSASFRSQPEDSCASDRNQLESDSKKTASTTSSLCKLKCASAKQLSQSGRERTKENVSWSTTSSRHRFTPKRRFWKPDEHNNRLVAQQHLSVQRTPNQSIKHKCDSSDCDATDNEVVVPPTPAAETRLSVKLRRRLQTELSSSSLGYSCKGQPGDKVNCKRTLLDQTLTCSRRGLAQTANCDNETIDEDQSDCCLLDDQNEACDWSRDLFSDSV